MKTIVTIAALLCLSLAFLVTWTEAKGYYRNTIKCRTNSAKCSNIYRGCNVKGGICQCRKAAFCCQNPFQYRTLRSCLAKNKQKDPCKPNPCKNDGYCAQVNTSKYRCMCYGTGFYGKRCHEKCDWKQKDIFKKIWQQKDKTRMRQILACLRF